MRTFVADRRTEGQTELVTEDPPTGRAGPKKDRNVTQKFPVSQSDGIIINHWNILDHAPWSGQGRRIKCIYLDSPKVGDSAGISFIPWKQVFRKTKNYQSSFFL